MCLPTACWNITPLPTCKSDIWSQKDHMVVIDRTMEWRMGPCEGFEGENLHDRFVVGKYCYLYSEYVEPKNTIYLRGKSLIYFTLSKSNWGAVNLAAQKQLSECRGMRGRKRQRVEGEKRRREWDTKAVWAHYVDFSSTAKQRHPGTFRHTTGDQSQLSFSFSPHRVSV